MDNSRSMTKIMLEHIPTAPPNWASLNFWKFILTKLLNYGERRAYNHLQLKNTYYMLCYATQLV